MTKKVLIVTTISRTAEAFLIPHIRDLIDRGYEVGLASNFLSAPCTALKEMKVPTHHIEFQRNPLHWKNIRAGREIKAVARAYDMIHVHTPVAAFITRMSLKKRMPVIYSAHGFHFTGQQSFIKNWIYQSAEKRAAAYTSHLIVTNQEDEEAAKHVYQGCPVTHVRGVGLDCEYYSKARFSMPDLLQLRQTYGIAPDMTVITHIGEFNKNKSQIDLIHAAAELKKQRMKFFMLLAGEGKSKPVIEKAIIKYKLEKYIKCVGFVDDVPALLSMTHIGLLVSEREGLPKSLMEMMAMEVPVIATDIRGNRDLVTQGVNGFLVPVHSPQLIAEKLIDLMSSTGMRREMGKKNRQKVCTYYSLTVILKQIREIYDSIL